MVLITSENPCRAFQNRSFSLAFFFERKLPGRRVGEIRNRRPKPFSFLLNYFQKNPACRNLSKRLRPDPPKWKNFTTITDFFWSKTQKCKICSQFQLLFEKKIVPMPKKNFFGLGDLGRRIVKKRQKVIFFPKTIGISDIIFQKIKKNHFFEKKKPFFL